MVPRFTIVALFLAHSLFGGVSLRFDDIEDFTDFTIHGLFHQEAARSLLEKQIQSYWERKMKDLLPQDATLELHFTDIDMAGEMRSLSRFGQSHVRVTQDRFPPRLHFQFRVLSSDGTLLASGSEDLLGRRFMFRNSRTPPPGEVTFFYELELLYRWLDTLPLNTGESSGQ